jgi:hypothetical protein
MVHSVHSGHSRFKSRQWIGSRDASSFLASTQAGHKQRQMNLMMAQNRLISSEETKWRNMMIACPPSCTSPNTANNAMTMMMILSVVIAALIIPLADGMKYNGTCDNMQPPWTELLLEQGQFERVVYSSLYQNENCSGEYWGTGASMNFEGLNCAPSPSNGNICFRCINGTLAVSHFDVSAIPNINASSNELYLEQATSTAYINCADGCGYTCYQLEREQLSMRVGWHSNDQPLCSNAPDVCPDVAPPQPAAPSTNGSQNGSSSTSSSQSTCSSFSIVLLSALVSLGAAGLLLSA